MTTRTSRQKACQCGCGKQVKPANRFLLGHKKSTNPVEVFARHIDIGGPAEFRGTNCWNWNGGLNGPAGYGSFRTGTVHAGLRTVTSHRFMYEIWYGRPVPDGLVLDHLCRNRRCLNPLHLEAVTQRVNILRGRGPTAHNALKTHCPAGHEYSVENTYIHRGMRYCRTCKRDRPRAKRAEERNDVDTVSGSLRFITPTR